MTTMNISLPEDMKAFVEAQMTQEGYATASEYLRLDPRGPEAPGQARPGSEIPRGPGERPRHPDDS